jgi:uncharacterized membrane protein
MSIVVWFWLSFVLTVATMGGALASGLARNRRHHLWLGPVAIVCLAVAIYFAEQLGAARVFPPDEMRIHLWFAKAGGLLALPVVVTGLLLLRMPRLRRLHRYCVYLFVVAVLAATGTGIWVYTLSTPR